MSSSPGIPEHRRKRQKGALMVGVLSMLTVSLIWSAIAFQAWIDVLRRDNEAEMIFRAQDIVRAIQRYRRDHGGQGPLKLEDLLEPSPKRSYYIRREYDDPLVPDGKWGLLYMGPGGAIIDPNEQKNDMGLGLLGGGLTSGAGSQGSQLNPLGQSGQTGQSGIGQGQNLAGTQAGNAGLLGGVGNPGQGGQGVGLPIAGVKSLSEEPPFRVYKGETDYAKWLFTYLDIQPGGAGQGKGKGKGKGGLQLKPGGTQPPNT